MKQLCIAFAGILLAAGYPPRQDLDQVLQRADQLLEEAKAAYDEARSKSSVPGFVDAGFKLEGARIKYLVLQEIGPADKQKIASERLRAVNQLTKLINDGRIAISSGTAKPVEPGQPPASAAPQKPPAAPAAPALDVSKRLPPPEAAQQKEAEKLIREIYKDQYGKRAQADRKALARTLLDQITPSQNTPAEHWVLCREAQDLATQACDVATLVEAIEASARTFDVDPLTLKDAALDAVAKVARTAEDHANVTRALLDLSEELLAVDQYDPADKAADAAVEHARKSNNPALVARAGSRAKEVPEAKQAFMAVKGSLQALAKDPEDAKANFEMGLFLCFVKGNWDHGTRYLAKGSDPQLRALAEKELAPPVGVADRVALADGWFELADKEKSPLRNLQMQARAKTVYESALAEATGLTRTKITKRLSELNAKAPVSDEINLLALMSPADSVGTAWTMSGQGLLSPNGKACRIQIPYVPGESEYDLVVAVHPKEGTGNFEIGLAFGKTQFMVDLDGTGTADASGLHVLDGKAAWDNETAFKGKAIGKRAVTIVASVRRTGVSVTVDKKKIIDYKGSYSRLSMDSQFAVANPEALFLGAWRSQCLISKLTLKQISGQGKLLR